jgi:hypothetical protein
MKGEAYVPVRGPAESKDNLGVYAARNFIAAGCR